MVKDKDIFLYADDKPIIKFDGKKAIAINKEIEFQEPPTVRNISLSIPDEFINKMLVDEDEIKLCKSRIDEAFSRLLTKKNIKWFSFKDAIHYMNMGKGVYCKKWTGTKQNDNYMYKHYNTYFLASLNNIGDLTENYALSCNEIDSEWCLKEDINK